MAAAIVKKSSSSATTNAKNGRRHRATIGNGKGEDNVDADIPILWESLTTTPLSLFDITGDGERNTVPPQKHQRRNSTGSGAGASTDQEPTTTTTTPKSVEVDRGDCDIDPVVAKFFDLDRHYVTQWTHSHGLGGSDEANGLDGNGASVALIDLPLELRYAVFCNMDLTSIMRLATTSHFWLRNVYLFFGKSNHTFPMHVFHRTSPYLRSTMATVVLNSQCLSNLSVATTQNRYVFNDATAAATSTATAALTVRPVRNMFAMFECLEHVIEHRLCEQARAPSQFGVLLRAFSSRMAVRLGVYLTQINTAQTLSAFRNGQLTRGLNTPNVSTMGGRSLVIPLHMWMAVRQMMRISQGHYPYAEGGLCGNMEATIAEEEAALSKAMQDYDLANYAFFNTQPAFTEVVEGSDAVNEYHHRADDRRGGSGGNITSSTDGPCCDLERVKMPRHGRDPLPAKTASPSLYGGPLVDIVPFLADWARDELDSETKAYLCHSVRHMRSMWQPAALGWLLAEVGRRGGDILWCAPLLIHASALSRRYASVILNSSAVAVMAPTPSSTDDHLVRMSKVGAAKHFVLHCYYALNHVVLNKPHTIVDIGRLFNAVDAVARLLTESPEGADLWMMRDGGDKAVSSANNKRAHNNNGVNMIAGINRNQYESADDEKNRLASGQSMFDNVVQHFLEILEATLARYDPMSDERRQLMCSCDMYLHMLCQRRQGARANALLLSITKTATTTKTTMASAAVGRVAEFERVRFERKKSAQAEQQRKQSSITAAAVPTMELAIVCSDFGERVMFTRTIHCGWTVPLLLENVHLVSKPRLVDLLGLCSRRSKLSSNSQNGVAHVIGHAFFRLFQFAVHPSLEADVVARAFHLWDFLRNDIIRCCGGATTLEKRDAYFLALAAILSTSTMFERVYEQVYNRYLHDHQDNKDLEGEEGLELRARGYMARVLTKRVILHDAFFSNCPLSLAAAASMGSLRSGSVAGEAASVTIDTQHYFDFSGFKMEHMIPSNVWTHCYVRGMHNVLSVLAIRCMSSCVPETIAHFASIIAYALLELSITFAEAFYALTETSMETFLRGFNSQLERLARATDDPNACLQVFAPTAKAGASAPVYDGLVPVAITTGRQNFCQRIVSYSRVPGHRCADGSGSGGDDDSKAIETMKEFDPIKYRFLHSLEWRIVDVSTMTYQPRTTMFELATRFCQPHHWHEGRPSWNKAFAPTMRLAGAHHECTVGADDQQQQRAVDEDEDEDDVLIPILGDKASVAESSTKNPAKRKWPRVIVDYYHLNSGALEDDVDAVDGMALF